MEEEKRLEPVIKQSQPIPFNAKEVFKKENIFNCQTLGFPTVADKQDWFINSVDFERDLEDLMRKYKVVQVVASFFPKL